MSDDVELLRRVYELFNRRDMEGGHVHGRDGVRSYWKRQWAMVDPHVEPVEMSPSSEGEVTVKVHQAVRDLKGNPLADRMVTLSPENRSGLRSGNSNSFPLLIRHRLPMLQC